MIILILKIIGTTLAIIFGAIYADYRNWLGVIFCVLLIVLMHWEYLTK